MNISAYGASDQGLLRPINEDSFYLDVEAGIFIVADGLGGLDGGEVASQLAIRCFTADFLEHKEQYPERLEECLRQVSRVVHEHASKAGYQEGMGTTFSVGLIVGEQLHIAHVGDTLIACLRDHQLHILTTDHTEAQQMMDNTAIGGDIVIYDEMEHSLTSCIGQYEGLLVHLNTHKLQSGDRLLLCTDGLTKMALYPEIKEKLASKPTPKGAVSKLLAIANARGGPDNTTAIVAFVE